MIIQAKDLKKSFKSFQKKEGILGSIESLYKRDYTVKDAVKPFNLTVDKPQIIGLLGPNGAGKTTLMKMFTGIVVPSQGELQVLGENPWERKKNFRKKIALVMGQKSQLWWDIPAMDSFILLKKYYELSEKEFKTKIEFMSDLLGVKDLMRTHVRKLSLGERMKLELMASLLHSPEVLFLDEPTIGLDLVAQENIRKFVKEYYRENNVTIIITSHYMADVAELCKRLVLIFDGEKKYDGKIENFEKILGNEKSINFTFNKPLEQGFEILDSLKCQWNENKTELEILVDENDFRQVSARIIEKLPVSSFHTEKLPIEKVMKKIMENPNLLKEDLV